MHVVADVDLSNLCASAQHNVLGDASGESTCNKLQTLGNVSDELPITALHSIRLCANIAVLV